MRKKNIRIIPRLDIKGPNLVKGLQFDGYRVMGSAKEFARYYYHAGADELIYQDAVASLYRRNSLLDIIQDTAENIFIPLMVAGGIRSIEDIRKILNAGADRVAINTAAVENPKLLSEAVQKFGAQCIVSSIEAYNQGNGRYEVWVDYGREVTQLNALDWAREVEALGVGEILLTCIDREGTGKGFDLDMTECIASAVNIPVIACGGAGKPEDFCEVIEKTGADAVAAASIFHYECYSNFDLTDYRYEKQQGLRMGEHVDSGNIDFINIGYGGQRTVMVEPSSVKQVKIAMDKANIGIRPFDEEKK